MDAGPVTTPLPRGTLPEYRVGMLRAVQQEARCSCEPRSTTRDTSSNREPRSTTRGPVGRQALPGVWPQAAVRLPRRPPAARVRPKREDSAALALSDHAEKLRAGLRHNVRHGRAGFEIVDDVAVQEAAKQEVGGGVSRRVFASPGGQRVSPSGQPRCFLSHSSIFGGINRRSAIAAISSASRQAASSSASSPSRARRSLSSCAAISSASR